MVIITAEAVIMEEVQAVAIIQMVTTHVPIMEPHHHIITMKTAQ